jgi:isopentenyl-diphosphate delta-isomerase
MTKIEGRKADHINICLEEKVSPDYRYWDDIRLLHEALPEVDYDDIDTSCDVLGKKLSFPFIVTAITNGNELIAT